MRENTKDHGQEWLRGPDLGDQSLGRLRVGRVKGRWDYTEAF